MQLRFDQLLLFTMDCAPELERCNELWFDDGTVVLQAENVIFRVYMGILIRHSEHQRKNTTEILPDRARRM